MAGTCDGHSFLSGAKAASSSSSAWRTWAMAAARSANAPSGIAPVGGSVTKLRRSQASVHVNWAWEFYPFRSYSWRLHPTHSLPERPLTLE